MGMQGVTQNITPIPITLSIKLTPQINKMTNFVKMAVSTKMGDINNQSVPKSLEGQSIAVIERTANTSVIVGDSDTVILGGLIRTKIDETVNKIPILGDIPLLGWLFRAKTTKSNKTNLVIMMTPHVIRQYDKVRTILDQKLKERDDFLEASSPGGADPSRWKRDDIIRNLPDINQLKTKKPPVTVTLDEDQNRKPNVKPAAVLVEPSANPTTHEESPPPTAPTEGVLTTPEALPPIETSEQRNPASIYPGGGDSSSGGEAPVAPPAEPVIEAPSGGA